MQFFEQELTAPIKAWPTISKVLSTLHTKAQYDKAANWLDKLVDEVCKKEDALIESLIDTLGTLIKITRTGIFLNPRVIRLDV